MVYGETGAAPLADEGLISLVAEGNTGAFGALYDRHARAAYSLAYRLVGSRTAAEDLVQDAFLKIWQKAHTYRPEKGSAKTWVLSVTYNQGVDELRSTASRGRTQESFKALADKVQPCEAFASTWEGSLRAQTREALRALPPDQLEVMELAYFSGYSHAEISSLLGLPLGTVKGRVRLGHKKLRETFRNRTPRRKALTP